MSKQFQIHDFIENYPEQEDEDIQWKTASRKEFYELSSNMPREGKFFNHQEIMLRYTRQYDRILNIQATGTGKSGGIINIAEFYKKNDMGIKRIYVIQPGDSTKESFKYQVKKLSNPDEYINPKIVQAMGEERGTRKVKNNINRLVNEWYSIDTYKVFAKENYNTEKMIEYYSDCVFFLDEAHWFRNSSKNEEVSGKKEIEEVYDYFWKIFHTAKRIKVILATATPIVNNVMDFVPLVNLLLPEDRQLPDYIDYNKVSLEQIEPYFRGLITYIRFDNQYINIVDRGKSIENYSHEINVASNTKGNSPELKPVVKMIKNEEIITLSCPKYQDTETKKVKIPSFVKLVELEMSDHQYKTFEKYSRDRKNFDYYTIQSSLFVFPNGTTGSDGEKIYLTVDDKKNMVFQDTIRKRIGGKLVIEESLNTFFRKNDPEKSLENLKMMSVKFHYYIKKELENSLKEKPGNSFCYIEYVSNVGAKLLGLFLKLFGFEEFRNIGSVYDEKNDKIRGIKEKKRFLVLTSENSGMNQELINIFNSKDNMDGKYIQIVIGSKAVRDGISLKNVVRGYIMTPTWHESGTYQALSRFIRADSHIDMYKREGHKINIDIYRLAAVKKEKLVYDKKNGFRSGSIDVQNYIRSEEKDINFKRIFRFMKITAFDAYLNYSKNVLPTDVSGNPESDYTDKYYKIWKAEAAPTGGLGLPEPERKGIAMNQGPSIYDIDYTTYNIFYSEELVKKIKKEIKDIFLYSDIVDIEHFKKHLRAKKIISNDYTFYNAIQEMMINKTIITDSKNIVDYVLDISGNFLYLRRFTFHKSDKISNEKNIYFDFPYSSLVKEEEMTDDIYKDFKSDVSREYIISYYIKNQNYELFKKLLEDSLIRFRDKNMMPVNENIISLLDNYIIETKIPYNYIAETEKSLAGENRTGQGRTRGEESVAGLKYVKLEDIEPGYIEEEQKTITLHFYRSSEKTGFGITSVLEGKERKIRILEGGEKFRDATLAENFVYNHLFAMKYDIILEKYKKGKYYGSYIMRGGETEKDISNREMFFFRIVDNSNLRNKGLVCKNWSVDNLKPIVKFLDTEKKYKDLFKEKVRKNKLCEILKKLFIEKNLMFVSL